MLFRFLFLGCSLIALNGVIAFERQLGLLNFTCTNSTGTRLDKLTVIEAKGEKDLLYYLWDFESKPTFLIVQVPLGTHVRLNCDNFIHGKPDSLSFSSKPRFVFGVLVDKLYEFNDANDTAVFNSSDTSIRTYRGMDFRWNVTRSQTTQPIPLEAFRAVGRPLNSTDSGTLEIAVGAYTGDGPSVEPPHILHTANGSQVDIVLNNFRTTFNQSRFAIKLTIFSSIANLNYTPSERHVADDENTPGVFKLNTIKFVQPEPFGSIDRGYLVWLPLVFKTPKKLVTQTTSSREYNMTDIKNNTRLFNGTVVSSMSGVQEPELFAKGLVISFGSRNDKFYQETRYSSWSFVFGTGAPPNADANSFFYLAVFCACIVLAVAMAVVIAFKWMKIPAFLSATPSSTSHEVLVNE